MIRYRKRGSFYVTASFLLLFVLKLCFTKSQLIEYKREVDNEKNNNSGNGTIRWHTTNSPISVENDDALDENVVSNEANGMIPLSTNYNEDDSAVTHDNGFFYDMIKAGETSLLPPFPVDQSSITVISNLSNETTSYNGDFTNPIPSARNNQVIFAKSNPSATLIVKAACRYPKAFPYFPENQAPTKRTVGVYYYPWHQSNFHRNNGYLREFLKPRHVPYLGEYDDRECEVVGQHLKWSDGAKIRLWVASWWGPGSNTDVTLLESVLPHPMLRRSGVQIAVHYETHNRLKCRRKEVERMRAAGEIHSNTTTEELSFSCVNRVATDIAHLSERYFSHPDYYRTPDGRPVLFVYRARSLIKLGDAVSVTEIMRQVAFATGDHDVYLVADLAHDPTPTAKRTSGMDLFDAVTNYDAYGSMMRGSSSPRSDPDLSPRHATRTRVDAYFASQRKWRDTALSRGMNFVPGITPGYNDAGVRYEKGHPALSRRLDEGEEYGSLFRSMLESAMRETDPGLDDLILVNSFNEWHEDTQIEPVVVAFADENGDGHASGVDYDDVDINATVDYARGVEYEAYGMRYLNILREMVE